jgi:light-regulated signal transduction histidine kinase (bacteriophytochrome)
MNLLGNAFKFTRPRPVARIEVRGEALGNETVYSVRDNGVGFEPQYAQKLFGIFQRLHDVDEFEGTGIGLGIVKRIVDKHGGRVWAEGTPDNGATFHFALPR